MVKIETPRLMLRDYEKSDWQQVHAYSKDPEVTRYMLWGPNSEQQTQGFVSRAIEQQSEKPRTSYELVVALKASGDIIGGTGLRIKSLTKKCADIGYCYSQQAWGKGYASEAALALLKFGFDKLDLHRIYATCVLDNGGSAGVMRKIGMRQEAHFKSEELIKGEWKDSLLYAILEDEWRNLALQNREQFAVLSA